jgi:hypothetical protein
MTHASANVLGLIPASATTPAPPLQVAQWFHAGTGLALDALRGRVVALHAFQMLCPGCVGHALPQAQTLQRLFAGAGLVIIGLHSVFEHHAAMRPEALAAFLHEYRIDFPVAVDAPVAGSPLPATLQRYGLRGTPSLVLIDRAGRRRLQHFGRMEDIALGAAVGALLAEHGAGAAAAQDPAAAAGAAGCSAEACAI